MPNILDLIENPQHQNPDNLKVVVAMSGGVDSSVVACLLKEKGYDVVGITLQLYDHGQALQKKGACCAGADILDARKVAEKFDFPHYVLNYESLFRESVIDDFADSYIAGETPIPCIRCNQSVKFRDLMKVAKDLGADFLATGHYVKKRVVNGASEMHRAADLTKDQSYFLFATTKEQLDFLSFPLGSLQKEETRREAQRLGLEIADKADSQDICFVPDGNYSKVIEKVRPGAFKAGDIADMNGEIIGQHSGIINYTIGQRKGLGISAPGPLFVIKIDAKNNQIVVGAEKYLEKSQFTISELNWLSKTPKTKEEINVQVKLRSSHQPQAAKITLNDKNSATIIMSDPTRAITPGQACVIYNKNQLLGGGWITKKIS